MAQSENSEHIAPTVANTSCAVTGIEATTNMHTIDIACNSEGLAKMHAIICDVKKA